MKEAGTYHDATAISRKGRKSYPTIYRANSYDVINGDYLSLNAERLLGERPMKIRSGNGASIVV
jgi:hypothetical protein